MESLYLQKTYDEVYKFLKYKDAFSSFAKNYDRRTNTKI